jgi:hypothetical protein
LIDTIRRLARERRYVVAAAAGAAVLIAIVIVAVVVGAGRSAPVTIIASPSPSPSPTATQLGMWRIQGTITDTAVKPLGGVCIGVGPAVCTSTNPRTDTQGRWFIDLPAVEVEYDLHFTKDGYQPVSTHIKLNGPQTLGVVLSH